MKVAIIGDKHIGARGSNPAVRDFIGRWCEYAFEDMHKRGITKYIQLGDAFDARRHLNGMDYEFLEETFIPLHEKYNIQGDYIDGNHDLPYKETNKTSWVSLLQHMAPDYIHRYNSPTDTPFGLFLPWICQANAEDSLKAITESKAPYCFGHLELGGFDMYKGSTCEESRFNLNAGHFSHFKHVFSGHFHTKSTKGNITYVGTPYPLTWQDYADAEANERGYHILDLVTGEVEFVPNPEHVKTFFKVLTYDWNELQLDEKLQLQFKSVSELEETIGVKDKIVKVIVTNVGNAKHYKDFVDAMRKCCTIDVTYVNMTVSEVGGDSGAGEGGEQTDDTKPLDVTTDVVKILSDRVDEGTLGDSDKSAAKELIVESYEAAMNADITV